jgi:Xaa-Pro aminopeptidase
MGYKPETPARDVPLSGASGLCPENSAMDRTPSRREQLVAGLADENLELLLVSSPINVSYLTGFSGESSYLVLGRDQAVLVSDGRFTEQLAEECPGLEVFIRPPVQPLAEAAAAVMNKLGARRLGFESGHLTVSEFEQLRDLTPSCEWKGGRDRVERLRAIKDAGEIDEIRAAIDIAERAFAMFRAMLQPENTEKELSDALEMLVRRAGGRCTSFPSIVAAGARAALPHAPPTPQRIGAAGLLLVDWGASGRFYKSDLTRVLVSSNKASIRGQGPRVRGQDPKLAEVYGVVLQAQQAALEAIRPGINAGVVDAAARAVIAAAGYGELFTHSLGHGLGLQVHEAPLMKPGSEVLLQAGMVVTVEPGIYLPDWGGVRIEDDVLVTQDGCEVLTHVAKDLEAMICEW